MNADSGFFVTLISARIMQVIIRHLGREVRAIRDLLITRLNIKEVSENITNNLQASLYWFDLALAQNTHQMLVLFLGLL